MTGALLFYLSLFLALVVLPMVALALVVRVIHHAPSWGVRLAAWTARFPRLSAFLARRFDPRSTWGLAALTTALFVALGMWIFLGVLEDVLAHDPLATADVRLHNTLPLLRTPLSTSFALALSALGGFVGLSLSSSAIALLLGRAGRWREAGTLLFAVLGSALLSTLLKLLVDHPRPVDGLVAASQASFPSGHTLAALVVCGLLATFILRAPRRRFRHLLLVNLLLLLAVMVGVSRIYLGVHWPSDVLASFGVAIAWLAVVLFVARLPWRPRLPPAFVPLRAWLVRNARPLAALALLATAGVVVVGVVATPLLAPPPVTSRPIARAELEAAFPPALPRRSEGLVGDMAEPISLVLVGAAPEITAAFHAAGWSTADPPRPVRVLEEMLAAYRNQRDDMAPVTPAYWNDRPQGLAFEKPNPAHASIRTRHHTRLWQTGLCLAPACRPIWVVTASFDVGVELSEIIHLPTHRIDPDVDREREHIAADLRRVGGNLLGSVTVVPPSQGTHAAGDAFFSDRRALLIELPSGAQ